MAVEIIEVTTPQQLKAFVRFPHSLYYKNPYYVPLLDFDELNTLRRDKNPAFEFCEARYWLALKNGKIAGRIAGILNRRANEAWGKKQLRFGWIDFIDDEEVVKGLFKAVEGWARQLGMEEIHGPLGFTDLDREGMLIEGFNEVGTLAAIYYYPYYPQHLEQLGFRKDVDWIEYQIQVPEQLPEKVGEITRIVKERHNLHTLKVKKSRYLLPYAQQMFTVFNQAYKVLYGMVPLTPRQIDAYVKQYIGLINPRYIAVVLDKDDQVVGFGITMPSLVRALQKARGRLFPCGFLHILWALHHVRTVELLLVGVLPELQGQGVPALMIAELAQNFTRMGVRYAESNPELEHNAKVQALWKGYTLRQHKRRRCFVKSLI